MKIIALWILYLTVCFWACFHAWKKYRQKSASTKHVAANVAPLNNVADADFEIIDERSFKQRLLKIWERIKAWSKKPKPKKKQRDLSWVRGAVGWITFLGIVYFFVAKKVENFFATQSMPSEISLFTDVWASTWVRVAIGVIILGLITWLIIRLVKRNSDKSPRKENSVLNVPGKFWDEHKKAVLGTLVGLVFFNLFLAYVEPFTGWSKGLRETGANFFWINAAIFFAVLMTATVGGSTGSKLSRLAWGLTAIALITFTWNYFSVGSKMKSVASGVSDFFSTKDANAQGTGGKETSIPARNRPEWFGPERDRVLAYYVDIPILANIAAAESQFHHWNKEVNRGTFVLDSTNTCKGVTTNQNTNGTTDIGVMQINSSHRAWADSLGYDLCTLEGNMAFARVLYQKEGTTPWNASKERWSDNSQSNANSSPGSSASGMKVSYTRTGTDGPWSEWIYTGVCKLELRGVDHRNISMQGEDLKIYPLDPDYKGEPVVIPDSPRWRFRSNTEIQTDIRMEITC